MLKILLVDDSKYQRYLLKMELAPYGSCDEAEHGKEAVRLYSRALSQGAPYSLIIMDILMPEMDGHAAMEKIRELQCAQGVDAADMTPTVMLSSLEDTESILKAQFEGGAVAYLTKPFEASHLLDVLSGLELIENPRMSELNGADAEPSS